MCYPHPAFSHLLPLREKDKMKMIITLSYSSAVLGRKKQTLDTEDKDD